MQTEKVGQRIKTFMARKEIDVTDLARQTDLSADFLQSVIDDNVYPSLGPLLKIARVLDVRLGTFLDDQLSTDPIVMRQGERTNELSMLRGKNRPVDLKFYSLGKGKSDRHMEPFYVELLPESAEEKNLSSHEGEEFIVVQRGEIEVLYGDEVTTLGVGDSIYYNSIIPHCVSCKGEQPAAIYAVLYIPR